MPIEDFPTGTMRGRFNKADDQLYICGMSAWATSPGHEGGFYRISATGKASCLPVKLEAFTDSIDIEFSESLATPDIKAVEVTTWSYVRSAKYGSKRFDLRGWMSQLRN